MNREQLKKKMRGLSVAIPTAFSDDDQSLDLGTMADLTQWWVENGLATDRSALKVAAAWGEGPDLSDDEWPQLLKTVVAAGPGWRFLAAARSVAVRSDVLVMDEQKLAMNRRRFIAGLSAAGVGSTLMPGALAAVAQDADEITVEMLEELPLMSGFIREVRDRYPDIEEVRLVHEITRRQITAMVEDVIGTAQQNLADIKPESADDVRLAGRPIITFGAEMAGWEREIKSFLFANLYRHPTVMKVREDAARIVDDLFHAYMEQPSLIGEARWRDLLAELPKEKLVRYVRDYIAGMTDTYAMSAHKRLFDRSPDLS